MLRYKWNQLEEPSKLSDQALVEKYIFYKFCYKWHFPSDNELLDKIQDLRDEITRRRQLNLDNISHLC